MSSGAWLLLSQMPGGYLFLFMLVLFCFVLIFLPYPKVLSSPCACSVPNERAEVNLGKMNLCPHLAWLDLAWLYSHPAQARMSQRKAQGSTTSSIPTPEA
ncbi:unnamed protein product [Discosporangium mesarthrocarpum]